MSSLHAAQAGVGHGVQLTDGRVDKGVAEVGACTEHSGKLHANMSVLIAFCYLAASAAD